MRRVCFQPLDVGKWFKLGFCFFLAGLTTGSLDGGGQFNLNNLPGPQQFSQNGWLTPEMLVLFAVVGLALLAIFVVLQWVAARGTFMALDNVVRDESAIAAPWREFRELGNSLWIFNLLFTLGLGVVGGALIGLVVMLDAVPLAPGQAPQLGGMVFLGVSGTLIGLSYLVLALLLHSFVIPTMYIRNVYVLTAWRLAWTELVRGQIGTVLLFGLLKLVIAIGAVVLAIVAICATCCLAALPYLSTVALLPVLVFERVYTLLFIEQYGGPWLVFRRSSWPPLCEVCLYDLRGNTSGACPECGTAIPDEQRDIIAHPPADGLV